MEVELIKIESLISSLVISSAILIPPTPPRHFTLTSGSASAPASVSRKKDASQLESWIGPSSSVLLEAGRSMLLPLVTPCGPLHGKHRCAEIPDQLIFHLLTSDFVFSGNLIMQYFTLYLKSTGYFTIPQINSIPTAMGAVNFFTMVTTGYVSDKVGSRAPACLVVGLFLIMNYTILSVWDVAHSAKMFAFIFCGVYGCFTPLLAGWCNEVCGGDQQKRALILGLMTSVGPAAVIPFQQLQFPTSQAPAFKSTHGWPSALAFVVALTVWCSVCIPLMQKYFSKRVQTDEYESEREVEAEN